MENLRLIKPSYMSLLTLTQHLFFFFFFLPPAPLPPFEVIGTIALVFLLIQQEGENQGTEAMESRCLKDYDPLGFLLHREMSHIDIDSNK